MMMVVSQAAWTPAIVKHGGMVQLLLFCSYGCKRMQGWMLILQQGTGGERQGTGMVDVSRMVELCQVRCLG